MLMVLALITQEAIRSTRYRIQQTKSVVFHEKCLRCGIDYCVQDQGCVQEKEDGYRLFSLSSKNSLTCSCVERVTAIRPERVYCNTQPYSFRA